METHTPSHLSAYNLQLQDGGAEAGFDLIQHHISSSNPLLVTNSVILNEGSKGQGNLRECSWPGRCLSSILWGRKGRL